MFAIVQDPGTTPQITVENDKLKPALTIYVYFKEGKVVVERL